MNSNIILLFHCREKFFSENLLKDLNLPKLCIQTGCQIRRGIVSYLYFDQICKQKIIDIPNNTKKVLNRIVSVSAKLIINDCT